MTTDTTDTRSVPELPQDATPSERLKMLAVYHCVRFDDDGLQDVLRIMGALELRDMRLVAEYLLECIAGERDERKNIATAMREV